ncbi:MAG: hypothetical protein J6Y65_01545 [Eggerthellaceae bacterium]|nr:hypothetical protein [Eggerthellaceae bacterium]
MGRHSASDIFHPLITAVFYIGVIVLVMCSLEPVYVASAWIVGLLVYARKNGLRPALKLAAGLLFAAVFIACLNAVVSSHGVTLLFKIGTKRVALEAIIYGLCMGGMLGAVITWFLNFGAAMDIDKALRLGNDTFPVIGTMLSMSLRLVPQFFKRGKYVADVASANTAAYSQIGNQSKREKKLAPRLRLMSVLLGWGMEDSLETSFAMKAYGWAVSGKRTSYKGFSVRKPDVIALVVLLLMLAFCAVCAIQVVGSMQFIESFAFMGAAGDLPHPEIWQACGYAGFAVLLALPLAAEFFIAMKTRRSVHDLD